jgi:hypothetical protein
MVITALASVVIVSREPHATKSLECAMKDVRTSTWVAYVLKVRDKTLSHVHL